jgi:uncharacterized protein YraI
MAAQGQTVYENQTLNLSVVQGGTVNVSFSGMRSFDSDGTIYAYKWYFYGNVINNLVSVERDFNVNLEAGTYQVNLEVFDNYGSLGTVGAAIVVSAPNQSPVARISMSAQGQTAYENQTLSLTVPAGQTVPISFSASRSYDSDGSITSYQWYISGNPISTARDFNFSLGAGTHQIYLEVRDNLGALGAVGAEVAVATTGKQVTVANTSGMGLYLRSGPGINQPVITGLTEGTTMSVIGGPVQADGYTWWNITGSQGTGWSAVGEWLTPISPQLNSTVTVTYTGGYGLRLRTCGALSCPVITTLSDGTQMTVFSGPFQADGYTWWALQGYVGSTLYTGWSAVGNWLIPNPRY